MATDQTVTAGDEPAFAALAMFRAFKFDVMRIEGGMIAEITTFNADLFPAFGLRPAL